MSDKVKGKHEYVELEVDELSVVDKAANLKEFAVIKCQTTQEGDEMSQEKEVKKEDENVVEVEVKDEETSTEATESRNDSVKKALVNIDSLVEKVVKSLEKDEKEVVEKEADKKEEDNKEVKKEETEVETKDNNEEEPEVDEEVETTKMLDQLLTSIQKAKSLTPSRVSTLKKVNELLTTFFSEVEPNKDKKEVSKSVEDKSNDKPDFDEVKKAIDGKLDEVLETMKSLTDRIDEIEKTRAPSSSIDDEGDTETVEKRNDDNFWSGLPIG